MGEGEHQSHWFDTSVSNLSGVLISVSRHHESKGDNCSLESFYRKTFVQSHRVDRFSHKKHRCSFRTQACRNWNRNRPRSVQKRRRSNTRYVRQCNSLFCPTRIIHIASTGLKLSTYFSAVKLRWMIDHHADVKNAHDTGDLLFGTVESWVTYVRRSVACCVSQMC